MTQFGVSVFFPLLMAPAQQTMIIFILDSFVDHLLPELIRCWVCKMAENSQKYWSLPNLVHYL